MTLNRNQKAILVLLRAKGVGTVKVRKILNALDNNVDIVLENISSVRSKIISYVNEKDYKEICLSLQETDFSEMEISLEKKGIKVVSLLDDIYPDSLKVYDDAPLILYCKGNVDLLCEPCFAVVGTRYPTKYGQRVTEDFVGDLCSRFCIVSGMARGVDSIAHKTCLNNFGKTIAVLGCGVDVVYPSENKGLYDEIVERGLVISEYEPGEGVSAHNFPARNRIVSGLSRGVLVTEAGEKSGTILTINYALDQGKDVFCVPGSIYNQASSGCNKYIKDCQSRSVTNVNDIYDELGLTEVEIKKPSALQLDINENAILEALTARGELHFEEIMQYVDLTVPQLNSLLIKMESVSLITKTKHNYWSV